MLHVRQAPKTHRCDSCDDKIRENDYYLVIVTEIGLRICNACVKAAYQTLVQKSVR